LLLAGNGTRFLRGKGTKYFIQYKFFFYTERELVACGQFRGAWPAANEWGGLRPEIWENLFRKSEKIV